MLLHAMLLRYTSNIKVEEGMEKRATRANSTRNGRREAARERESEERRAVGRRWSASRDERGRERRTGGEEAKVGPRNNHVYAARY